MIDKIKKLQKELHRYPELSGNEKETSLRIRKFVEECFDTQIIENIGGYGLAVIVKYSNEGPVIMIRCELDALPVEESLTLEYSSQNQGVSHKCGHDGHMAIVAGLIYWLKIKRFRRGKVILLFQPAEETGLGARKVLDDQKFLAINPDYIFALHNIPGQPMHSIITVDKEFCATVQSIVICLIGRGAHSAQPENGNNPALCMADLVQLFDKLNKNNIAFENFTLFVPVYSRLGRKSYGISPGYGELHYTLRTRTSFKMKEVMEEIERIIFQVAEKHQMQFNTKWVEFFPSVVNDHFCNQIIAQVANKINLEIIEKKHPFKFGEDFGWFSQKYRTAMFGLGAGLNSPGLHQATYDFPEELIETGISMFSGIIESILE